MSSDFSVFQSSELFITAKVRGVLIKDSKIFLCKLAHGGFYCLPGGTLEPGETRLEGLRREIIEELGVEPKIGPLVYSHEFVRSNGLTTYDFWYAIENVGDFENIDISKATHGFEHEEVGFYDLASIAGQYKPIRLPELLEIWNREPEKFIQPE